MWMAVLGARLVSSQNYEQQRDHLISTFLCSFMDAVDSRATMHKDLAVFDVNEIWLVQFLVAKQHIKDPIPS